ncbi:hypothetical protein ACQCSU_00920 [Pseudarthrobacter sp. O4]|uniref:hypothetical protein n=1 Tax=Pseudarthrobacter sp. O4 TaxID=3418417 RepID=UPI003CEE849E
MDIGFIGIVAAALCGLGVLTAFFRNLERRADAMEHRNPDVAKALRDHQRRMDQGNGYLNL